MAGTSKQPRSPLATTCKSKHIQELQEHSRASKDATAGTKITDPPVPIKPQTSKEKSNRSRSWKPQIDKTSDHLGNTNRTNAAAENSSEFHLDLQVVSQHIPQEIWDMILNLALVPRVLPIERSGTATSFLFVSKEVERIPGAPFTDRAARSEMMKTHSVAFKTFLFQPALFNADTDVLHFESIRATELLPDSPAIMRKDRVRFVAITRNPEDDNVRFGEHLTRVARACGTLEKLVIVQPLGKNKFSKHSVGYSQLQAELAQWACQVLSDRWADAKMSWDDVERKGFVVFYKWTLPAILVIQRHEDILDSLLGETNDDGDNDKAENDETENDEAADADKKIDDGEK